MNAFARLYFLVVFLFIPYQIIAAEIEWNSVSLPEKARELELSHNDVARLLAGFSVKGMPPDFSNESKSFFRQFTTDIVWRYENQYPGPYLNSNKINPYLENITRFKEKSLAALEQEVVIYPFGGPDVVFPALMFSFNEMIAIGQEPIGDHHPRIYEFNGKYFLKIGQNCYELKDGIEAIAKALSSILLRTYFVTNSMEKELQGSLAVAMMVQLVTLGAEITDVGVNDSGDELSISYLPADQKSIKKITYLAADLKSQNTLDRVDILAKNNNATVFLKASSYLLYPEAKAQSFASFIEWINERSSIRHVVQSVSGMAIDSLAADRWNFHFFGAYLPFAMAGIFTGTVDNIGVDKSLMHEFYTALNQAQPRDQADHEYKQWILENCKYVKKNYPDVLTSSQCKKTSQWDGRLGFALGYPCFLSCDSDQSLPTAEWKEATRNGGEDVSFLMIATKKALAVGDGK